jgi:hypothetical protein
MAKKIEDEAKTRAQFQRLLSPNLVEQIVAGKLQLEKGGELREVTVLGNETVYELGGGRADPSAPGRAGVPRDDKPQTGAPRDDRP